MTKIFANALKGFGMGIAEVIPGVSGGTKYFITGIYHTLIKVITAVDFSLLKDLRNGDFKLLWKKIDGNFITSLMVGMALGVILGALLITKLLVTHPEPLWGFFFGLIVASSIFIFKEISEHTSKTYLGLLLGIVFAYIITVVSPAQGSENYLYVFLSGMLAICALILPGISGSFILLLLGMYSIVIPSLKNVLTDFNTTDLGLIMVFASGCTLGLIIFSRFLTYLFDRYKNTVLAVLTGFMIGSLNKIWPWRNVLSISDKETGLVTQVEDYLQFGLLPEDSYKIMKESQVLPSGYKMDDPKVILTCVALVLGFLMVRILSKYSSSTNTY